MIKPKFSMLSLNDFFIKKKTHKEKGCINGYVSLPC